MNDAEKKLKVFQLRQHLKSLREWKAQYDRDVDFYSRERLHAAAESVRTASAISKLEDRLKELENHA